MCHGTCGIHAETMTNPWEIEEEFVNWEEELRKNRERTEEAVEQRERDLNWIEDLVVSTMFDHSLSTLPILYSDVPKDLAPSLAVARSTATGSTHSTRTCSWAADLAWIVWVGLHHVLSLMLWVLAWHYGSKCSWDHDVIFCGHQLSLDERKDNKRENLEDDKGHDTLHRRFFSMNLMFLISVK